MVYSGFAPLNDFRNWLSFSISWGSHVTFDPGSVWIGDGDQKNKHRPFPPDRLCVRGRSSTRTSHDEQRPEEDEMIAAGLQND